MSRQERPEKELINLREVCRELGLTIAEVRALAASGSFVPIEWTGPRSGYVWAEDIEEWRNTRHDRSREWCRQRQLRASFVKGAKVMEEPFPEFLRKHLRG